MFLRLLYWKQIFRYYPKKQEQRERNNKAIAVGKKGVPDLSQAPRHTVAMSALDFCSNAAMSVPFPQWTGSSITGFHDQLHSRGNEGIWEGAVAEALQVPGVLAGPLGKQVLSGGRD